MATMESKLRSMLAGFPGLRRGLRRGYQMGMYGISKKVKSEGALRRVTPDDGGEWFFGYYDKSPWDRSGKRVLCLRAEKVDAPAPDAPAMIYVIEGGRAKELAQTRAWNAQQGCMLQWLGPDFSSRVIYNDFRDGQFVSVIYDVNERREVKVIGMPVYSVCADGKTALTLDFARLHRLRPGYGYVNLPVAQLEDCPDAPCIWRVDLESGHAEPILTYTQLRAFEEKASMRTAAHKVNHIMVNPSGTRAMVLHRWIEGSARHSRLITFDLNGQNLFTLADEDFVSHCNWTSDSEILSFCRLGGADGYYALRDQSLEHNRLWPELTRDGHMSVSPNGLVVTDSYPDKRRMQSVYLMDGKDVFRAARVFSPFRFDGDVRCDLHPRFDRAGERVMIDATFEGRRALYEIPALPGVKIPKVLTVITVPMAYDGPTMSVMRYTRGMDASRVMTDFVAINDPPESIRREIAALGGRLYSIQGRLKNPILYAFRLARLVRKGRYDIVHAHGNSCTLAIEMLAAMLGGARVRVAHSRNSSCKFMTAHKLLRPLFDRLYTDAYACGPEAGQWLFEGRPFHIARIAVETEKYAFDEKARAAYRRELGVSDELLIGSVAHFTPHKNHGFLLGMFAEFLKVNPTAKLALVGDGMLRAEVEARIRELGIEGSVLMLGTRTDVPGLLQAFDAMILPSLYEGFPNVLVEWQCAGLASFVSDTVTPSAALTELVEFLPIDSPAPWVDALSRFTPPADRETVSRRAVMTVREKGYDILENARAMQKFYIEAAGRKRR